MRYAVQLLIPVMVIVVVALVLIRNRSNPAASTATSAARDDTGPLSTGTFMAILIIGAIFTVALVYALHDSAS